MKTLLPDLENVLSEEFVEHMLNATKEFLALRSVIDSGLDRLEVLEEITKAKRI